VAASVLDSVLAQLNLTPAEYFERLETSLDEARERRALKAAQDKELESAIHQPAAHDLSVPVAGADEDFFGAPPEGDAASTEASRAKAKERRVRVRPGRVLPEEEPEDEFSGELVPDEDNQFRQAYRRAMRQAPRRPRER